MRTIFSFLTLIAAVLFTFSSDAFAQGHGGGGGHGGGPGGGPGGHGGGRMWPNPPGQQEENAKMSVIKITGMDGKVTFEAVKDKDEKQREQELSDFYDLAKQNYKEAKKKAEGTTGIFSEKEPKKPKVEVLKSGLDEESANKYKDTYSESYYKARPKDKPEEKTDNSGGTKDPAAPKDPNAPPSGFPAPGGGRGFGGMPGAVEKNKKYSAVKIITHEGKLSFEVIPDADTKVREDELNELYRIALDGYREAKKTADKENKPFADKEPPKPEFTVIKAGLSKESAQRYCDEHMAAYEKSHPTEKPSDNPVEKPKDVPKDDPAQNPAEKKEPAPEGGEKKNTPESK
jgi:hypothetical protein